MLKCSVHVRCTPYFSTSSCDCRGSYGRPADRYTQNVVFRSRDWISGRKISSLSSPSPSLSYHHHHPDHQSSHLSLNLCITIPNAETFLVLICLLRSEKLRPTRFGRICASRSKLDAMRQMAERKGAGGKTYGVQLLCLGTRRSDKYVPRYLGRGRVRNHRKLDAQTFPIAMASVDVCHCFFSGR